MANRTVYPYGTDGQLPSSIGIVNDLVTGGADKALSAQMGVTLNGMVQDLAGAMLLETANVEEEGLFFVDGNLNIGVKIVPEGLVAINNLTYREV